MRADALREMFRRRTADGDGTRARYAEFLPHAHAVVESTPPAMARLVVVATAALFFAVVWWSAATEVDQVITGHGLVRPAGETKIVNHPEGGRVARIDVAEGDRVQAGDSLLALDATIVAEEIAKRTREWQSLAAEVARLEAEAGGTEPVFDPEIEAVRPDLIRTQRQLFDTRRRAHEAQRAEAERTVDQRRIEHETALARERQLARSRDILSEQKRSVSQLADKGFYPRLRYLSIEREANDLDGQVAAARNAARGGASSLAEAEARLDKIDEDWRSEVLTRLTTARRERDLARSAMLQQVTRERGLVVRAPIAGIVQDLAVTAPGQAIGGNTPLMSVVPVGADLLVEAMVSNEDIGHVSLGQPASVKVRAFDFVRYGVLDGRVERIAADSTQDPRTLRHGYRVMIRTDRADLGDGERSFRVHPGMEVEVDLSIGKRSILSYLTDRLQRDAKSAFRER